MRNWAVFIFLVGLIIISFLIWGDWLMSLFNDQNVINQLNKYGFWAWGVGILLLVLDLFLPIPATIIMSALGFIYGPLIGGLLATSGNFLSGFLAFTLCRSIGTNGAQYIIGKQSFKSGKQLFEQKGGWIVAVSRWLPILPEAISCMAGLNQMRTDKFVISLICGSLPLGFVFAIIGYWGIERPTLAIIISAVLPAILWIIAQYLMRQFSKPQLSNS